MEFSTALYTYHTNLQTSKTVDEQTYQIADAKKDLEDWLATAPRDGRYQSYADAAQAVLTAIEAFFNTSIRTQMVNSRVYYFPDITIRIACANLDTFPPIPNYMSCCTLFITGNSGAPNHSLLTSMTNINAAKLYFDNCDFTTCDIDLFSAFPHIPALEFDNCSLPEQLVISSSTLEELRIANNNTIKHIAAENLTQLRVITLTRLHQLIDVDLPVDTLQRISIGVCDNLQSLSNQSASKLEHLELFTLAALESLPKTLPALLRLTCGNLPKLKHFPVCQKLIEFSPQGCLTSINDWAILWQDGLNVGRDPKRWGVLTSQIDYTSPNRAALSLCAHMMSFGAIIDASNTRARNEKLAQECLIALGVDTKLSQIILAERAYKQGNLDMARMWANTAINRATLPEVKRILTVKCQGFITANAPPSVTNDTSNSSEILGKNAPQNKSPADFWDKLKQKIYCDQPDSTALLLCAEMMSGGAIIDASDQLVANERLARECLIALGEDIKTSQILHAEDAYKHQKYVAASKQFEFALSCMTLPAAKRILNARYQYMAITGPQPLTDDTQS